MRCRVRDYPGEPIMVEISLDKSLLVQIINVLALMFCLNHFLFKPLRKILLERAELLARLSDRAAVTRSEIESGEAEKTRLKTESLRQAISLKNNLADQSRTQSQQLLAEAQEKALSQINESRARLRQSAAAARTALKAETQNLARDMAEKILGRNL
jgi:F-type H+-transporting ATPase subunit b